jgi:iron complex outermembrane receptor protein
MGLASPAMAQSTASQPQSPAANQSDDLTPSNDIIVTARRRAESVQDVPQTVNVVTAAEVEKLNLRNFTDISNVVPGLQLQALNSFANTATVRGIAFSPVASGNNPSVEFYLNDAPISSGFLFQTTYDFGQFELQRGPQGTLRGRASPSGSIAVTTHRPDLDEVGVVVNGTVTDQHDRKIDGAFNIPIIRDVLGVRLAGVIDENQGNEVHSIFEGTNPDISTGIYNRTKSIRASARFEPTDWASFNVMYQALHNEFHSYQQVASDSVVNPTAPASNSTLIGAFDRMAIDEQGTYSRSDQRVITVNADIRFAGQKLSYVGSWNKQDFGILAPQDAANFFTPPRVTLQQRSAQDLAGFDQVCSSQTGILSTGAYDQCTHSIGKRQSHELRLASDQRLGGIFDYVVGLFYDHNYNRSDLTQETPVILSAAAVPLRLLTVVDTSILTPGTSTEKSAFGNLTAHLLDDKLELSGGLRYISYKNHNDLFQSSSSGTVQCSDLINTAQKCNPPTTNAQDTHATIYTASIKYKITPDIMVYALTGSSWRPGPRGIGNFSFGPNRGGQTARELYYENLPAERSKSYEIGLKSSFMNGRGQFNISAFHQTFQNYPFVGPLVFYISTNSSGVESVANANNSPTAFGFISPVPVTVNGGELEASYKILDRWSVGLNAAYADGKIKNATIACTDLNGDGIPDFNPARPTVAQLHAAVGAGQTLSQCSGVNRSSAVTPKFSANIQSEFDFDVGPKMDGFVRGLYSFFGSTQGSLDNPYDDVGAYGLLNLYAGIRDKDGRWEISVFGKNITQEQKILSVDASLVSTSVQVLATGTNQTSPYRAITVTAPREFGITARIAFGSK